MQETMSRQLSPRQCQVMDRLSRGLVQKEIAEELGIALPTVRTYIRATKVRLNARTLVHAVVRYVFPTIT